MPPAARIAAFFGESAALVLLFALPGESKLLRVGLIGAILYGPPAVTTVAMLWWAMCVSRRNQQAKKRGGRTSGVNYQMNQ